MFVSVKTAVFAGLVAVCGVAVAQFPGVPSLPGGMSRPSPVQVGGGSSVDAANLSEMQIGSGVKEALAVGTERAVKQVARPGGYLEDPMIKILLPPKMRPVERGLRAAGQGAQIDNFVASMNRAAEGAAPAAGKIFAEAVRALTIDDARRLLTGGDTSITDYFRAQTSGALTAAFRPKVDEAMEANGVTRQYDAVMQSMPKLPFGGTGGGNFDLHAYVVQKALDGLFFVLGQKEREIRANPAARSTAVLRQVFGGR